MYSTAQSIEKGFLIHTSTTYLSMILCHADFKFCKNECKNLKQNKIRRREERSTVTSVCTMAILRVLIEAM